jgi:hypothetical protein
VSGYYVGRDGYLYSSTRNPSSGVCTIPWVNVGGWGKLRGNPTAMAYANGYFTAFAAGTDSHAYSGSQNPDGTWTWADLGGAVVSDIGVGMNNAGAVSAFVLGTDYAMYSATRSPSNGSWSAWVGIGGHFSGDTAAVAYPSSGLFTAFGRGGDGALYTASQNSDGTWTGWLSLGGSF